MLLLSLGLILWIAPHFLKRLAPGLRESWGERGKGAIALLIVIGVVLMVIGYRSAEFVPLYDPLPGMGHANNTLMLISVFLFGVGGTKGTLYTRMRHPMLTGQILWAVAHLLVNGDLASVVLFGGIGLWALVQMVLINLAGPWARPVGGRGLKGDAMNLAGTLILFGVIAVIHQWLGHPVFLGTY
ncbi:NnrU family protein [Paracoccaceae bacterium]